MRQRRYGRTRYNVRRAEKAALAEPQAVESEDTDPVTGEDLTFITNVAEATQQKIWDAGFLTVQSVADTYPKALAEIDTISLDEAKAHVNEARAKLELAPIAWNDEGTEPKAPEPDDEETDEESESDGEETSEDEEVES